MEFVWKALAVALTLAIGVVLGYEVRDEQAQVELDAVVLARETLDHGPCAPRVAAAKEEAESACMARMDPSGCDPQLHDLMAGTYHRTPPGSTDCSRLADGGVWSW